MDSTNTQDWLNPCDGDVVDDDYRFVYIGPQGSFTPLHADVLRYSYIWTTLSRPIRVAYPHLGGHWQVIQLVVKRMRAQALGLFQPRPRTVSARCERGVHPRCSCSRHVCFLYAWPSARVSRSCPASVLRHPSTICWHGSIFLNLDPMVSLTTCAM